MNRPRQTAESYAYATTKEGVGSVTRSAQVIVPLLCDSFQPTSVLDVGCGVGDWLRAFLDHGVSTVRGYDGPWVPTDGLLIPLQCFQHVDFYVGFPDAGKFDLAICLEVAEHVSTDVAKNLIAFLCNSANLVFFSAAIPGQGGYEHINEHYQEHWIAEFKSHGFSAFDCVRPQIWMNDKVSWWYQQNCFVFANSVAKRELALKEVPFIASLIHPFLYEQVRDPKNYSLKAIAQHLPDYLARTIAKWRV